MEVSAVNSSQSNTANQQQQQTPNQIIGDRESVTLQSQHQLATIKSVTINAGNSYEILSRTNNNSFKQQPTTIPTMSTTTSMTLTTDQLTCDGLSFQLRQMQNNGSCENTNNNITTPSNVSNNPGADKTDLRSRGDLKLEIEEILDKLLDSVQHDLMKEEYETSRPLIERTAEELLASQQLLQHHQLAPSSQQQQVQTDQMADETVIDQQGNSSPEETSCDLVIDAGQSSSDSPPEPIEQDPKTSIIEDQQDEFTPEDKPIENNSKEDKSEESRLPSGVLVEEATMTTPEAHITKNQHPSEPVLVTEVEHHNHLPSMSHEPKSPVMESSGVHIAPNPIAQQNMGEISMCRITDNQIGNEQEESEKPVDKSDEAPRTERAEPLNDSAQQLVVLEATISESVKLVIPEDDSEDRAKDIVTLRNLEISPPPPSVTAADEAFEFKDDQKNEERPTSRQSKRKRSAPSESTSELNESSASGGRGKRQRTQTKLFQAGESLDTTTSETIASPTTSKKSKTTVRSVKKQSTASSKSDINHAPTRVKINQPTADLQDVILYEKNDYLAIRNEENTFYLCQLTENIRCNRPFIRVRWLDTGDNGKTYYLTPTYDKVPQKSIIMPVPLNRLKSEKKGTQLFSLEDSSLDTIMERLKRSLNLPPEFGNNLEQPSA